MVVSRAAREPDRGIVWESGRGVSEMARTGFAVPPPARVFVAPPFCGDAMSAIARFWS
jgi:hypothetical protein